MRGWTSIGKEGEKYNNRKHRQIDTQRKEQYNIINQQQQHIITYYKKHTKKNR